MYGRIEHSAVVLDDHAPPAAENGSLASFFVIPQHQISNQNLSFVRNGEVQVSRMMSDRSMFVLVGLCRFS